MKMVAEYVEHALQFERLAAHGETAGGLPKASSRPSKRDRAGVSVVLRGNCTGTFTETQFRRGKIAAIMEGESTMESILRTLREMQAKDPKVAPDPKAHPYRKRSSARSENRPRQLPAPFVLLSKLIG